MTYTFSFPFALICAMIGYLIGNIQTALLVSRLKFKQDIRDYGSHNPGTTNMLRVYGLAPGTLTFIGDFLKAVIAVLLGRAFMDKLGGYIAGLFVIIGHCYPALNKFKGGKGVASALGFAWMVFPLAGALVSVAAIVLFIIWKRISVCSLLGTTLFVLLVLLTRSSDKALVIVTLLIYVIIIIRHWDNIGRIFRGEEKPLKIHSKK